MHNSKRQQGAKSTKDESASTKTNKVSAGEKRTRADIEESGGSGGTKSKPTAPPTRQARVDSTHNKIDNKRPDAPRARNSLAIHVHQRPVATETRTGQLTMTPFLPKGQATNQQTTETDGSSPEVEITGHIPAPRATEKIDEVLKAVRMTEVKTPSNGSCLKYALVAAQAYECGDAVTVSTDAVHAKRLGKNLGKRLAKNVKGMIADGTLDIVNLCATVLGKVVEADSLRQLQEHFVAAGKQPCDETILRKFWGGEPELKAFVEWVEEALYVVDVMPDGTAFPQWYRIADVTTPNGRTVNCLHGFPRLVPFAYGCLQAKSSGTSSTAVAALRGTRTSCRSLHGGADLQRDIPALGRNKAAAS
jgi:hypothetical protein